MTAAQMGDHASLRGPSGEATRLAVQKLSTRDGRRWSCEPADSPFASTGLRNLKNLYLRLWPCFFLAKMIQHWTNWMWPYSWRSDRLFLNQASLRSLTVCVAGLIKLCAQVRSRLEANATFPIFFPVALLSNFGSISRFLQFLHSWPPAWSGNCFINSTANL